jgi:hypothetical protein
MTDRVGLLLAIVICLVLFGWWALSGFPMLAVACKGVHRSAVYQGPFSSICHHSFFQNRPASSRESI